MAANPELYDLNKVRTAERTTALPTSPASGPSLVDSLLSMRNYAQSVLFKNPFVDSIRQAPSKIKDSAFIKSALFVGTRTLLAASILSPAALIGDQVVRTITRPTVAEASAAAPNGPEPKTTIEAVQESPANPVLFIRNTGEKGELLTENGTNAIFPNSQVSIIDTTELTLDGVLKTKIQPDERMFLKKAPNAKRISTSGRLYSPMSDNIYLLNGFRSYGDNSVETPMVISVIPVRTAANRDTHRLMEISLPPQTPEDYVKSFKMADDCSYIEVITVKGKIRIYTDPMMGRETGKVEITQTPALYKASLSAVLSGTNR